MTDYLRWTESFWTR